ncbi:MAG: ankyrin repeat domain-containing protein, partial [Anaerolineae bacterium]|nr:ankyrin repeat domain-containing protein [Anaerolineae bacterium]
WVLAGAGVPLDALDAEGQSPLHWAALYGHRDVVNALLSAGADPTILNGNGKTALELARDAGHVEVAEALATALTMGDASQGERTGRSKE